MKTKEQTIRDAAAALKGAIDAGEAEGLHVQWPSTPAGLDGIAISETGKADVTIAVHTPESISQDVAAKAGTAAQKAADKVIETAKTT